MRLLEAIVDANHRALAGDPQAGLHPAEFARELPIVALTCIDVRLNAILPQVLGVPPDQFIWLRNAGNIITGPLSSTMRSLALACALKGGKEIAIIGHSDCQVGKIGTAELIKRFQALGVDRARLPENLSDYFGTFTSERVNVIKAADVARHSPLISPSMAVHGLLVDIETGKLDWIVNGYQSIEFQNVPLADPSLPIGFAVDRLPGPLDFKLPDLNFPETKIGEGLPGVDAWLAANAARSERRDPAGSEPAARPAARIPVPPLIKPRPHSDKGSGKP